MLLQATAITGTGDGTRLRRAFAALLKNAANVSQTGTRVTVRSRNIDEGHSIEIEFQDTGSDLDGELVDRVFVPFDQGRPSTFGIGRLGVGRYVAKAVIEAHSGTLLAKRGATGGAAYVVTLPVRP